MTEGSDGTEGPGGDGVPLPFRLAVEALESARTRPEVQISSMPAPKRLAPYAFALQASVGLWDAGTGGSAAGGGRPGDDAGEEDPEELADGRFVLLYDPDGQEAWQGTFRVVTLGRADLEPELATDPLLPEVTWSWLTGALEAQDLEYGQPSGTVTRSGSYFFGGLSSRTAQSELEIRSSWTPHAGSRATAAPGTASPDAPVPDLAAHLAAWCELLCQCAGLPPEGGDGSSVVQLPQRRGPQQY